MITEEKLRESVDLHLANLLADQVYQRLKEDLQDQWNTVISELVNTRKTLERTKEALNQSETLSKQVQHLAAQLDQRQQKKRELQEKEDKLLTFLIHELGMEE